MVMDAELLASDRALDQAWRGGVGVAMAATRAEELSDPLRLDLLLEEAKAIVSDHHACSPNEALTRLCFVSWYTDRRLRDIASEVVTFAADRRGGFADQSTPRPFRFTL
jgi:AmiR/NasT family two-component response regulator